MARTDVMVLGAGVVGASIALHLAKRGLSVALIDRQGPGLGTSYGNAGIIEGNTIFPQAFPGLGKVRWITRATSDDFLRWSAPQEMSFGDAPPDALGAARHEHRLAAVGESVHRLPPFRWADERKKRARLRSLKG